MNHKGQPCPYKPITCQEGYCQDCGIYLRRWIAWDYLSDIERAQLIHLHPELDSKDEGGE